MNITLFLAQIFAALGIDQSSLSAATIPVLNLSNNNHNFSNITRSAALRAQPTCGLSKNNGKNTVTHRIMGGYDAKIADFPWQVSLQRSSQHFCGGSIINENWIITAAHCLEWTQTGRRRQNLQSTLKVVTGLQTQKSSSSSRSVSGSGATKILLHPNYNSRRSTNDIALIRLAKPLNLSSNAAINSVCLPTKNQEFIGVVTASGWGRIGESKPSSNSLRAVDVPMVAQRNCQLDYGSLFTADVMICAGIEGKDSCQGDSGGPLIKRDSSGKATLAGITSTGNGCGRNGFPGIYTKVSRYIDWIQSSTS